VFAISATARFGESLVEHRALRTIVETLTETRTDGEDLYVGAMLREAGWGGCGTWSRCWGSSRITRRLCERGRLGRGGDAG
jgi:hypothetical protein